MDLSSLLGPLKEKADVNGDGKVDAADLEALKGKIPGDQFDKLKDIADHNNDGKIDFADIQSHLGNLDPSKLGDEVKDKLGGLGDIFGKK